MSVSIRFADRGLPSHARALRGRGAAVSAHGRVAASSPLVEVAPVWPWNRKRPMVEAPLVPIPDGTAATFAVLMMRRRKPVFEGGDQPERWRLANTGLSEDDLLRVVEALKRYEPGRRSPGAW